MRSNLTAVLFLTAASLTAQTIDTIGGTTTATTRAASSKASLFRVDQTVLLLDYEMFLDVPGAESLTFFLHRYHSRAGTYVQEWSTTVAVNGTGVGPAWYSTGPIALTLVEGNYYQIGVGWPGTLTYHYVTSATNAPVSFGAWQRAQTPGFPVPATWPIPAGHDSAQYFQRLTTLTSNAVENVGAGCSSTTLVPKLVASGQFSLGSNQRFELFDALPSSLAVFALGVGPTVTTPTPLFGCTIWLDLLRPVSSAIAFTSTTGEASLPFPIPPNPVFVGTHLSVQAAVVGNAIDITNAVDVTIG